VTPAEEIRALVEGWYWNPLKFCADVFGEQPREWQPEVIASVIKNPWVAVAACRKAGKTRLAAYIVLWFLCTRANSLVLTIAPTWKQVVEALWADIKFLWINSKLPRIFPTWRILETEVKTHPLTPKWRAIGLTSDDVQNLEGRHPAAGQPALVILDEAKGVRDIFFESTMGMLGELGVESRLLAISTPGLPRGFFYRGFSRERHLWKQFKIAATEIPRLAARAEARRLRVGADDSFYLQQEMAEFSGGDEGILIPFSRVEKAIGRRFLASPVWVHVAALDIAGEGDDDSVLTFRHGPVLTRAVAWQGWDPMKSAYRVADALRDWLATFAGPATFIYDEVGIGAGIGSRIRELVAGDGRLSVHGFNAGRTPRDKERYENLKAEEIFFLRERFLAEVPDANGELGPDVSIPDEPMLIEQLCSWVAGHSKRGKTIVIDPDDSPDYADSGLMNFAADRLGQSVRGITPSFLQ
jgi:hypothetical protein